jgi:hypothetical protein
MDIFYSTNHLLFLMIAGRRWSSRRQTRPPAWLTCPSSPPVSPQRPGGRGSCSPPLSRWQAITSVRRGYFAVLWIRIRSGVNGVPGSGSGSRRKRQLLAAALKVTHLPPKRLLEFEETMDPDSMGSLDPDRIRIQRGPCIRVRIQEGKNDLQT